MGKKKKVLGFKDHNDFLVEPLDARMEGAPIRGFAFEAGSGDPLEPLALSNDEKVKNLFLIVHELRNDLHQCRNLPEEFPKGKAYDTVRFSLYAILVGSIINSVNHCLRELIQLDVDWESKVSKSLARNVLNGRATLRDRTKYAFQAFSSVFDLSVSIDVNGSEWQSFTKMTDVREGLVHPSELSSFALTDNKVADFMQGWNWFCKHFPEIIDQYSTQLNLKTNTGESPSIGFFTASDVVSELVLEDQRDHQAESKKRQAQLVQGFGMPKKLAQLVMLSTQAIQLFEDSIYVKTDNAHFKLRVIVVSGFAAIESKLYFMRKIIEAQCEKQGAEVFDSISSVLGVEVDNIDGLINELSTLKMESKLRIYPSVLSKCFGLSWVFTEPNNAALLGRYVELRNRIHHPKQYSDLQISSSEYKMMCEAYSHLRNVYDSLLANKIAKLLSGLF